MNAQLMHESIILFYNIFNAVVLAEKIFSSRHLFADVISMRNGNMKHTHANEFDYANLLAML